MAMLRQSHAKAHFTVSNLHVAPDIAFGGTGTVATY